MEAMQEAHAACKPDSSSPLPQPRFNLPILQDGECIDTFLSTFEALGGGFTLTITQKGLYFMSSVRGEAKKVLESLSTTSYNDMVAELQNHFSAEC